MTDQAATDANTAVDEVEGQIRAFVRRDVSGRLRSKTSDVAVDYPAQLRAGTSDIDGAKSVIDRVAGASVSEIERVIAELSGVRDMLRSEAERVEREISSFASLSQVSMKSMKIIADSLAHWKSQTPKVGPS